MPAILRIPGAHISGPPAPPPDARLTGGSLLLVDPSHPVAQWSRSATPGTTIPNLAAASGSPAAEVTLFSTATDPTRARIEVLPSGSIHLDTSQTVDALNERVGVSIPQALRDYLYTNAAHSYYVGVAVDITRVGTTGQTVGFMAGIFATAVHTGGEAAIGMLSTGALAANPSSSSPLRLGFTTATVGRTSWGAVSAAKTALTGRASSYIAAAGPSFAAALRNAPSYVLRSLYIEDLTVSGRAHATVAALDKAAVEQAATRWAADPAPTPLA